jgi:hypothetical protein
MVLTDRSRVVVVKDQVSCNLTGEVAILNLTNSVYYGLNAVGARVWDLIQEPKTFKEVRESLLAEFDVEAAQLDVDLRDLFTQLVEQGLVEIRS